ncbi:MAG: hypothetical protein ACI4TA_08475 [Acetatifactor sp.]
MKYDSWGVIPGIPDVLSEEIQIAIDRGDDLNTWSRLFVPFPSLVIETINISFEQVAQPVADLLLECMIFALGSYGTILCEFCDYSRSAFPVEMLPVDI